MAKKKSMQEDFKDSAGKIWLAGLGAFALAEEEGGKMFKKLVARGEDFEKDVKKPVDKAAGKVKGTVKKVETMVDDQIHAALKRMGVPTRQEISDLSDRVEKLTRTIEELVEREQAPTS